MADAKQKIAEETLTCKFHVGEPIRYIYKKDQSFLCCKCILTHQLPLGSENLVGYTKRDAKALAKLMRDIWNKKCRSIDQTLGSFEAQKTCDNAELASNFKFISQLLPFN